MRLIAPDILQIHAYGVCIYALRRGDDVVLIDSGFIGASIALARGLKDAGWGRCRIVGIILTHGHLDHTHNAFRFAREFGAWVAAPELDKAHVAGEYRYTGIAKVCGWLEAAGRRVFAYEPPTDVDWFQPGREFDWLGGLEVVALPGHTIGHCGLFSAEHRLLFCGDLFASFWWSTHRPPAILNSLPAQIPASLKAALAMEIKGVLPAHCDGVSPEIHLQRLRRLADQRASRCFGSRQPKQHASGSTKVE